MKRFPRPSEITVLRQLPACGFDIKRRLGRQSNDVYTRIKLMMAAGLVEVERRERIRRFAGERIIYRPSSTAAAALALLKP